MKKIIPIFLILFFSAITVNGDDSKINLTGMFVSGMTCGSCLNKIDLELKKSRDYISLRGDIRRGVVSVYHRDSLIKEKIVEAVSALGYPARLMYTKKVNSDETKKRNNSQGGGYCSGGGGKSSSCCSVASDWKELFRRFTGKDR